MQATRSCRLTCSMLVVLRLSLAAARGTAAQHGKHVITFMNNECVCVQPSRSALLHKQLSQLQILP